MSLQRITNRISVIDAPLSGMSRVLGTYLIEGEKTAVIDPGPTTQTIGVLDVLQTHGVKKLDAVLLSHIHLDHGGGSWRMAEAYPGSFVYCHPKGAAHMVDPSKLKAGAERLFGDRVLEYGTITGVPSDRVMESADGEVIDLGGIVLQVLWTPGHSSHSQTYWEPDSRTVFVGDAGGHVMGEGGPVVPVSPPPHNPVKAVESIDRILGLRPETLCIAHFGPHDNAVEHLRRIRDRSVLWGRLSVQAAKEGMDLDAFTALVLEEDDIMQQVGESGSPERSLRGGLLGFHMYGKWKLEQG
ncbi:MBL fold metallo-hydrolase [Candidatus Bathyarchaeota archaeon]|nr:MBL fold metallo-hydrolase [Candidatus Bathyarchaeota archaeon]